MKPVFTKLIKTSKSDDSVKSKDWFRDKAQEVDNVDVARVIRQNKESTETRIRLGHLYLYRYNPKLKKELPYYDKYPIVFPIDRVKNGFLGLNMHYLPIPLRAELMDGLYDYVVGSKDTTRINANYDTVSNIPSLEYYKPCVKHYLFNHIETRFLHIDVSEWDIALFLPLQRFLKASEQTIYRDSISIIRRG
jgi:hypothetical protein